MAADVGNGSCNISSETSVHGSEIAEKYGELIVLG